MRCRPDGRSSVSCSPVASTTGVKDWLTRDAAVLAYPSLDEGFGFPLLDAMQRRRPGRRLDRRVDPRGRRRRRAARRPADDVDALAAAIDRVLTDDAVAERSWPLASTQLDQLLVGGTPRPVSPTSTTDSRQEHS